MVTVFALARSVPAKVTVSAPLTTYFPNVAASVIFVPDGSGAGGTACTLKTEQCDYLSFRPPAFLCRSSPRAISTGQLHALLHFHLRPINQVVFLGPYLSRSERSHLRGSFTLRCFQRLSRPYVATQLCRWHDNWCTRGMSIPVLSY